MHRLIHTNRRAFGIGEFRSSLRQLRQMPLCSDDPLRVDVDTLIWQIMEICLTMTLIRRSSLGIGGPVRTQVPRGSCASHRIVRGSKGTVLWSRSARQDAWHRRLCLGRSSSSNREAAEITRVKTPGPLCAEATAQADPVRIAQMKGAGELGHGEARRQASL